MNKDISLVEDPKLKDVQQIGSKSFVVEDPDTVIKEASVMVSLSQNRAGGELNHANISCSSIFRLNSDRGWIKISAKNSGKQKVEGWLHNVYSNKLAVECGKHDISKYPKLTATLNEELEKGAINTTEQSLPETSVGVLLHEDRGRGDLKQVKIFCKTISELNSDQGWTKIAATDTQKRNVEGWLHEVYRIMLISKCRDYPPKNKTEIAERQDVQMLTIAEKTPNMLLSKTSVKVYLSEERGGGRLNQAKIFCETISKLKTKKGWLKISAKASDKTKVIGWIHEIYANMLDSQCKIVSTPA
jgi:hypothetical protein